MDAFGEAEFERYFRARRDAVRRTAYLMCGDWHRADDHTQAAFVALHRHWRRVRDKGALDARTKKLIALAVAYAIQEPYCIDSYSAACAEAGVTPEEMSEAVSVAASRTAFSANSVLRLLSSARLRR